MSEFVTDLLRGLSKEELFFDSFLSSKGKKQRLLHKPSKDMSVLHRRMCGAIRSCKLPLQYATGGIPGRSVQTHIEPHLIHESRYFYATDLKDAFPSVTVDRLAEALCQALSLPFNEGNAIVTMLSQWFLVKDGRGLYQGGPASLDLFNVHCDYWLDPGLGRYCLGFGRIYTRYVDDLVVSGQEPISARSRKSIRGYITDAGFEVNHRKTIRRDLATGNPIVITGVGLRWEDGRARPFVPQKMMREARGLAHLAYNGSSSMKSVGGKEAINVLQGKMGYIRSCLQLLRQTGHSPGQAESKLVLKYLGLDN